MSSVGDIISGIREVLLIRHRIDTLADDLRALTAAHGETRERLVRLEVIIDEARRAADRRLPRT